VKDYIYWCFIVWKLLPRSRVLWWCVLGTLHVEATTVAPKITVEWRNAWSGWRRIQGWW